MRLAPVLFVLILAFCRIASATGETVLDRARLTQNEIRAAINLFAFHTATNNYLEQALNRQPRLATEILQLRYIFDLKYGTPFSTATKILRERYPKIWEQVQSIPLDVPSDFSGEGVQATLDVMRSYITDGLPPKALRATLYFTEQYQKHPEELISDGFYETFRSAGESKAFGLKFSVKYPLTWTAMASERPNIVISIQNGYVPWHEEFQILVNQSPMSASGLDPSIQASLITESFREAASALNGKIVEEGRASLEGYPGAWAVYSSNMDRMGTHVRMLTYSFAFMTANKMVMMTCSVGGDAKTTLSIDNSRRLQAVRPLCKQIMNSFAFNTAPGAN
jgi:hypothetical protein